MATAWWQPARFVFRPNAAIAGPDEVLVGLGDPAHASQQGIALTQKFRGSRFHSVAEYVLHADDALVAQWRTRIGEGWDEVTIVLEDLSLDTCMSLHLLQMRLDGTTHSRTLLEAWCRYVTRWERGYTVEARPSDQSIAQLLTTLGHSYLFFDRNGAALPINAEQFSAGARACLALLHDAMSSGATPDVIDVDAMPTSEALHRARSHLAFERELYRGALQMARTWQLSVTLASGRRRLVDALFIREDVPTGLLKVFARNDHANSWTGRGFEVLALHRPSLAGSGDCMVISVPKESGITLVDLWHALEAEEDRLWEGRRPRDNPRPLASYAEAANAPNQPWWDDGGEYSLIAAPKFVEVDREQVYGTKLDWHRHVLPALWRCYSPIPASLTLKTFPPVHGKHLACCDWSTLPDDAKQLPSVTECPTFHAWLTAASTPDLRVHSPDDLPLPLGYRMVRLTDGYVVVHRGGITVFVRHPHVFPTVDDVQVVFDDLSEASGDLDRFYHVNWLDKSLEDHEKLLADARTFDPARYRERLEESWAARARLLRSGTAALGHADAYPLDQVRAAYNEMLGLGQRRLETIGTIEQIDRVTAAIADHLREQRQRKWRAASAGLAAGFAAKSLLDLIELHYLPNSYEWQLALFKNRQPSEWLQSQAERMHWWDEATLVVALLAAVLGAWLSWSRDAKMDAG